MSITSNHNQRRRGFTLIELLIVVAIIGVLATLSAMVLFGIEDQAKEEATNATVQKVDGLLQKRIEAFERTWNRGGTFKDRYVTAAKNLLQQDRIFGVREEVVDVLGKKVAMRHNFPQRHEDLLLLGFNTTGTVSATDFDSSNMILPIAKRSIDGNGNRIADDVERAAADTTKLLNKYVPGTDNNGSFVTDPTVSSELLYFALTSSSSLGSSPAIRDQFTTAEVGDTDDDGLLEFLDSWGKPLQFYRWPTRMVDFNPPVPFQPILEDPDDPTDIGRTNGRVIDDTERLVANVLIKGLPPSPASLPNGALPRDLLAIDPDDPVGRLYSELERLDGEYDFNGDGDTNDPGESGLVRFAVEYNELNYHTPDTFHTPLIMSAGLDGLYGLHHASNSADLGHLGALNAAEGIDGLLDNLTNRNRRAGGR